MAKNILSKGLIAMLLLGALSCGDLPKETPEGSIIFDLYESAYLVEGTQNFSFGEEKTYELHSWFVTTMKITGPEGWSASFQRRGDNGVAIIVPPANAAEGDTSGDIEVELSGPGGQTSTYILSVAVF